MTCRRSTFWNALGISGPDLASCIVFLMKVFNPIQIVSGAFITAVKSHCGSPFNCNGRNHCEGDAGEVFGASEGSPRPENTGMIANVLEANVDCSRCINDSYRLGTSFASFGLGTPKHGICCLIHSWTIFCVFVFRTLCPRWGWRIQSMLSDCAVGFGL